MKDARFVILVTRSNSTESSSSIGTILTWSSPMPVGRGHPGLPAGGFNARTPYLKSGAEVENVSKLVSGIRARC